MNTAIEATIEKKPSTEEQNTRAIDTPQIDSADIMIEAPKPSRGILENLFKELDMKLSKLETRDLQVIDLLKNTKKITIETQQLASALDKTLQDRSANIARLKKEAELKEAKAAQAAQARSKSKTNLRETKVSTPTGRNKTPVKSINGSALSKSKTNLTSGRNTSALKNNNMTIKTIKSQTKLNTTISTTQPSTTKSSAGRMINLKSSATSLSTKGKSKDPPTRNANTKPGKPNTLMTNTSTASIKTSARSNIQKVIKPSNTAKTLQESKSKADFDNRKNTNRSSGGAADPAFKKIDSKIISNNEVSTPKKQSKPIQEISSDIKSEEKVIDVKRQNTKDTINDSEIKEVHHRVNTNASINVSNIIGNIDNSTLDNDLLNKEDPGANSTFIKLEEITEINNTTLIKDKNDYTELLSKNFPHIANFLYGKEIFRKMCLNKKLLKLGYIYFKDLSEISIKTIQDKFTSLKDKYSDKDLSKEFEPFKLTRGADKAIELINDPMYYTIFLKKDKIPDDDLLLPYKLLLQILNIKEICPIFNKSNSQIWVFFCNYIEKNTVDSKVGSLISSLLNSSIDDSPVNLLKIIELLGSNAHKITPNYYSKLCGATGLIVFFIKDLLEYYGIIVDRKSNPKRVLKTYSDILNLLNGNKAKAETKI